MGTRPTAHRHTQNDNTTPPTAASVTQKRVFTATHQNFLLRNQITAASHILIVTSC